MKIRARKYREAQKHAERALAQDKSDYALYTYLGLCHFHNKRYKEGLEQFQKSLDINSDAIENYYYMGLIFDNMKDYKKALQYYNVFFRLNPKEKNFKHKNWITQRMRTLQQYLNQQ
jgi:tetratricopeptide (TPR) repeat protein